MRPSCSTTAAPHRVGPERLCRTSSRRCAVGWRNEPLSPARCKSARIHSLHANSLKSSPLCARVAPSRRFVYYVTSGEGLLKGPGHPETHWTTCLPSSLSLITVFHPGILRHQHVGIRPSSGLCQSS